MWFERVSESRFVPTTLFIRWCAVLVMQPAEALMSVGDLSLAYVPLDSALGTFVTLKWLCDVD